MKCSHCHMEGNNELRELPDSHPSEARRAGNFLESSGFPVQQIGHGKSE